MNKTKTNQTDKQITIAPKSEDGFPAGLKAYPVVGKYSSTFTNVSSEGIGTSWEGRQLTNGIQVEVKLTDWDTMTTDEVTDVSGRTINLQIDSSSLHQYIHAFLDDPGQINFQLRDLEDLVTYYRNR